MRQSFVIGNWKMHGSRQANQALIDGLKMSLKVGQDVTVVVCPPAIYLSSVSEMLDKQIKLGAQHLCAESADIGAYTGEVSASMLEDIGVEYVIIGHSERRQYYGESNATVAARFANAQARNITPVLCVGEDLEQRENGQAMSIVTSQVSAVVDVVGIDAFSNALIAYEPVWAIGTGKTATPEEAQEVHAAIRQSVATYDEKIASKIPVLYGGSVKAGNAKSLFSMTDIDGALVGGASLKVDEFSEICKAATSSQ